MSSRTSGSTEQKNFDCMWRIAEIAVRSRMSPRQIRRFIASGELREHRLGRSVRISESDYQDFLKRCRTPVKLPQ